MRRIRAPILSLGRSEQNLSTEAGRGRCARVSDVIMFSAMACTLLLLFALHDARLMIWYEHPLSRARSLYESIGRPPPPLPPPSPPSPPPEYANLPRTVSFLSRNLEDNYMCEVGEVRASFTAAASPPPVKSTHHPICMLPSHSSSHREPLPGRAARAAGREGGAPSRARNEGPGRHAAVQPPAGGRPPTSHVS